MPNELEVIGQPMSDLAMSRPPEAVLAEAQKAAAALKEVISKKSKPVIMNGEQYLEYEDWQTVGHFYGLKVRTGDAVPVEINGVHGAKAQAWVIDLHTGREIGGAEAYCLRDERNWETKPWFQLASMAQTRAGSKSLRNVLAWVVVLAGYKPTPAEEMAGVFPERKPVPQVRPRNDATMVQPADKYTGEPIRQEDGAHTEGQSPANKLGVAEPSGQPTSDAPAPIKYATHLNEPAPSPVKEFQEFCSKQAEQAPERSMEEAPRLTFGKHKGKSINHPDIPNDYLAWLESQLKEQMTDPKYARYRDEKQRLLDAIRGELIERNAMPIGE